MQSRFIYTIAIGIIFLSVETALSWQQDLAPPNSRDRIERAIGTAGRLDVDQAIVSLSEYNESYELAELAGKSSASTGVVYVNSILADRRVSKIFEHLSSLPAHEADAKAQQIFDGHLDSLVRVWKVFVAKGELQHIGPPHHATSAGLFLCSFFCSSETLHSKIQIWNDSLRKPEFSKFDHSKLVWPHRLIDPMFQLNLVLISGSRRRKSIGQLNTQLAILCQKITGDAEPFLQVIQMKLFKWSAETLDTDFTHRTRGVPASENTILLELPGFASNDAWYRLSRPSVAEQCLNCVRAWSDN
jgi:hypothetical protein